jgi:hypothetical protein
MIIKVGDDFSLDGIFDVNILLSTEEMLHQYGTITEIPTDRFLWMNYAGAVGKIGFSRNTSKFYPELTDYVVKYLESLIDLSPYYLYPERVHFIRTRGYANPHRDEAARNCCINIGVLNTATGTTLYSENDKEETFTEDCQKFICQDGSAYLLDTSKLHAVDGSDVDRILITYGFGATFDQIRSRLR